MATGPQSASSRSANLPAQIDVPQLTAMLSTSSFEKFQRACEAGGFQMSALLRNWVEAYIAGRVDQLPGDTEAETWAGMQIGAAPEKVRFKVDESTAGKFKATCQANGVAMSKAMRVWIESFSWKQLQSASIAEVSKARASKPRQRSASSDSVAAYFRLSMPSEAKQSFADAAAVEGRAPVDIIKLLITAYGLHGDPSLSIAAFAAHQQGVGSDGQNKDMQDAQDALDGIPGGPSGACIPDDFDPRGGSYQTGVRVSLHPSVFKEAEKRAGLEGANLQIVCRTWAAAYVAGALDVGPIFDMVRNSTRKPRKKPQAKGALPAMGTTKARADDQGIDILLPAQLKADFFSRCAEERRVPQTLLRAWFDLYVGGASKKSLPGPMPPLVKGRDFIPQPSDTITLHVSGERRNLMLAKVSGSGRSAAGLLRAWISAYVEHGWAGPQIAPKGRHATPNNSQNAGATPPNAPPSPPQAIAEPKAQRRPKP